MPELNVSVGIHLLKDPSEGVLGFCEASIPYMGETIVLGQGKIRSGSKGIFASFPRHQDKKTKKWYNNTQLPEALNKEIQKLVLQAYAAAVAA